jgi:hypothetical protein
MTDRKIVFEFEEFPKQCWAIIAWTVWQCRRVYGPYWTKQIAEEEMKKLDKQQEPWKNGDVIRWTVVELPND